MDSKAGELSEKCVKKVTWEIPNFLELLRRVGCSVTSPEFRLADASWYLRVNLEEPFLTIKHIKMYLVREQSSVPEHRVYHNIVLKTPWGKEYQSWSDQHTFVKNSESTWLFCLEWSHIVRQRQLLLPGGTLTVFCHILLNEEATAEASSRPQQHRDEPSPTELREASTQTEDPESVHQTEEEEEASTSVQKLQTDYSKLLESEENSDVCLKVSGKEFRAHRCILRARSKVFSAMFKYDTKEKASGEVVIDDLYPDSFPDFLRHVYAGRVESITFENVSSLYSASDKYDLQELMSECREYMKRTLSVDTFCDVLVLALRYHQEDLLNLAIEFFTKNLTKIIVSVKWQTCLRNHHTEANELLIKALVSGENNES